MSKVIDDPRDASLETKFKLPGTWYGENFDGLSTSGMFLSGLIMVTRNRFLAWPSVLFGISSTINIHPLRAKDGGSAAGSLSSLLLCVGALVTAYLPLFMISNTSKTTTAPLPTV
ncbi:hypothetical protein DFH08DRAFT_710692 [Mycena albidolilacea]|uniref:Uncharacterized protein n=1 Tax=Mycena albidolilacea TaxID=1033008 RepID=A0AAD6ZJW7_9AGAR|nr:hypothetical protein DFH08DRAFT_752315 [Mycena albidolilacea]KAJ7326417.1 hypothetical protein DFH08DRAFT_710692 [Mycena albidolilacea]